MQEIFKKKRDPFFYTSKNKYKSGEIIKQILKKLYKEKKSPQENQKKVVIERAIRERLESDQ